MISLLGECKAYNKNPHFHCKSPQRSQSERNIRNMKSIYIYYSKELHTLRKCLSNKLLINGYKVNEKKQVKEGTKALSDIDDIQIPPPMV